MAAGNAGKRHEAYLRVAPRREAGGGERKELGNLRPRSGAEEAVSEVARTGIPGA